MKAPAVLFVLAAPMAAGSSAPAAPPAAAKAPASPVARVAASPVIVYYFHGTARCATCRTIEAYAHETVSAAFAAELRASRLEWKTIDVVGTEARSWSGQVPRQSMANSIKTAPTWQQH